MRATMMVLVLFASACAGKSPEPTRPAGGAAGDKPVGTKLLKDAMDSPKKVVLAANDGIGHGLGKVSVTVDGRCLWPPKGPGCREHGHGCQQHPQVLGPSGRTASRPARAV